MADENIIKTDGSCPFSVSDNLKMEVTSYDLHFEGIIIRYGAISGFRAADLVAPFHAFLMNVSDHDISWEIGSGDNMKRVLMEPNQIFFNPANLPFSRHTADYYEFILVLIEPEKLISSAQIVQNNSIFLETYHIKDPNFEYIFKLLLSEIQAGNQNGKLYIENIVSILAFHFVKNYSKEQSHGLVENVSGFTTGRA